MIHSNNNKKFINQLLLFLFHSLQLMTRFNLKVLFKNLKTGNYTSSLLLCTFIPIHQHPVYLSELQVSESASFADDAAPMRKSFWSFVALHPVSK